MKRKGNLSEELFKMRKLMNFNPKDFKDNVTSYDRLMEEKMVEKYLLSEQATQSFEERKTEMLMASKEEESLFAGACNIIGYIKGSGQSLSEDEIKKTTQRREDLLNKYGETYNKFLNALGNYPSDVTNCKIWFINLTQENRYAFINDFQLWVDENKVAQKLFSEPNLKNKNGDKITASITKGTPTTTVEKSEGEIPAPAITPFKFDMKGKDTFIDNCSDITQGMQSKIDSFIEMITPRVKAMLATPNGKVVCEKIDVAASSSRFRNTDKGQCDASKLTWADLSKQRANKVYEEIYRRLEELGVTFTNKHRVLRGGLNDDGTSGPNPGTNEDGLQYAISVDGTYNNIYKKPTPEEINKKGAPHNTKEEYDQYKFCTVEVFISGFGELPPQPYEETTITKSDNYYISFDVSYKLGGKVKTRKFNAINQVTKCEGAPSNTKCMVW